MNEEIEFSIEARDFGERVFVDRFDDGVWLGVHIMRGSASTILTREQAIKMVEALNAILAKDEIV